MTDEDIKKAYDDGQRNARVDAMLRAHELAIDELRQGQKRTSVSLEGLDGKVDEIIAGQRERAAVEQDRLKLAREASAKSLSSKNFILGTLSVVASMGAVAVSVLLGTHVI